MSAAAASPLAKLLSTLPRQQVPINKIKVRPEHRRTNEEAINGIVDGFKRAGQLQPILVRKIDPDGLMLIAGRQRLVAAQLLGWERIDARVIPACTNKEARMIEISDNLHRAELTTPRTLRTDRGMAPALQAGSQGGASCPTFWRRPAD